MPEGNTVPGPPERAAGVLGELCSLLLQQRCFPPGVGEVGCWHPPHSPCMWWGSQAGCRPLALYLAYTRVCNPFCTVCLELWLLPGTSPDELIPLPSPLPQGSQAAWLCASAAGGQIRGDRRKTNSLKCDGGDCLVLSAIAPSAPLFPAPSLSPTVFLSLWV